MSAKPAPRINDWIGGGRAVLRGVPVGGEFLDEGLAALEATFGGDRGKSWGQRWDNAVEGQRAYDAAFDARHPLTSIALRTAGNFAVPGSVLLGAASKLPVAAQAARWVGGKLMAPGSNLVRNLAAESLQGAAEGAADGFLAGHGGGLERAGHAVKEAVRGAVHPLLGKGLGKEVADGTSLRKGLRAQKQVHGILGRLESGGSVLGVLPLPWQAY